MQYLLFCVETVSGNYSLSAHPSNPQATPNYFLLMSQLDQSLIGFVNDILPFVKSHGPQLRELTDRFLSDDIDLDEYVEDMVRTSHIHLHEFGNVVRVYALLANQKDQQNDDIVCFIFFSLSEPAYRQKRLAQLNPTISLLLTI